jgi:hypothetical protein
MQRYQTMQKQDAEDRTVVAFSSLNRSNDQRNSAAIRRIGDLSLVHPSGFTEQGSWKPLAALPLNKSECGMPPSWRHLRRRSQEVLA